MSARVCNPMAMTEIAKLRSAGVGRNPISNIISLARVKRNLFGPVDKQESKKFIDRELAAHNEALSKKWGFDFGTGQPLQKHEQFQWERVPPTSTPACFNGMMTITRVAHVVPPSSTSSEDLLDQRAERENGNVYHRSILGSPASVSGSDSESDCSFDTVRTYPLVLRSETSAITATAAVTISTATTATSSNSSSSFPASANRAKRQQRITDYLKERKRLSTSSPKSTVAKKARQMLASSCSSSPSSATSSMSSSAMPSAQQNHQ